MHASASPSPLAPSQSACREVPRHLASEGQLEVRSICRVNMARSDRRSGRLNCTDPRPLERAPGVRCRTLGRMCSSLRFVTTYNRRIVRIRPTDVKSDNRRDGNNGPKLLKTDHHIYTSFRYPRKKTTIRSVCIFCGACFFTKLWSSFSSSAAVFHLAAKLAYRESQYYRSTSSTTVSAVADSGGGRRGRRPPPIGSTFFPKSGLFSCKNL